MLLFLIDMDHMKIPSSPQVFSIVALLLLGLYVKKASQ